MIRYLLDTDVLSYLMKKSHVFHQSIVQRLLKEPEGSIAISVISLAEIARGLENLNNKNVPHQKKLLHAIEQILMSLVVLEFDEEAAWIYGKIRTELIQKGNDIGVMDTLIASHALSQSLTLVTNNTKHFTQITKLPIENWCRDLNTSN